MEPPSRREAPRAGAEAERPLETDRETGVGGDRSAAEGRNASEAPSAGEARSADLTERAGEDRSADGAERASEDRSAGEARSAGEDRSADLTERAGGDRDAVVEGAAGAERQSAGAAEPVAALPPRTFAKGALVGLCLWLPATAAAVFALGHHGPPLGVAGLERTLSLALLFAGLPALVSGAGIARGAARALAEGARSPALTGSAAAGATAGIGLSLLAALPVGALADDPWSWLGLGVAGALVGALSGALIAAWVVRGAATNG